jgi:hypothetical protein
MARMAGSIGSILPVGLLGCTSICRMAPESRAVSLNWTCQTTRSDRGQTGTPWATSTEAGESTSRSRVTSRRGPAE